MNIPNLKSQISKKWFVLGLVIILAVILRFWHLGQVPISPDWDELALGYNAYSILHTVRDEYGKLLPVVLRSFDDYKPALYAYLAIPTVWIFGLTVFAVRLPSAILGTLTVILTFFLVRELTKKDYMAILASFLLAISPWHIQFSRVAFEANTGVFLNVLGILLFLIFVRKKNLSFLILSAISFGLNVYSYQSEKVFMPLIVALLLLIFHKDILKLGVKKIALSGIIGLIVIFPMINFVIQNQNALSRFKGVSVFSDKSNPSYIQTIKNFDAYMNSSNFVGMAFDNKYVYFSKESLGNYLSHFNVNWLFITGDQNRHHAPDMGLLYLWELPFILIGIYHLFFGNYSTKTKLVIFGWLILSPVPAAITLDVPHAVRTENFIPIFEIFCAFGIYASFMFVNKHSKAVVYSASFIFSAIVMLFFAYYLDQYFIQQNYYNAPDWQYGYKKMVTFVSNTHNRYNNVIVDNISPMDESYIFFLFYMKYSSQKYQIVSSDSHDFENFIFRKIDWDTDKNLKNTLLVGTNNDFPQDISALQTIYYPNGEIAMKIVSANQ